MTQRRHHTASETIGQRFPTRNDLPPDIREPVIEMLNGSLADTTDMQSQAKVAHWNVKGQNFYQLHLLFDELAETLAEHQDLLAERATALGGQALGTVRMAARKSTIPELPADAVTGDEYVRCLADNLAVHAANLRRDIDAADSYGDEDTMDLFIEISRDVDKYLWFLDAHLQTQPIESGSPATNQESGHIPIRTSGGRRYGGRSGRATGRASLPASNW